AQLAPAPHAAQALAAAGALAALGPRLATRERPVADAEERAVCADEIRRQTVAPERGLAAARQDRRHVQHARRLARDREPVALREPRLVALALDAARRRLLRKHAERVLAEGREPIADGGFGALAQG